MKKRFCKPCIALLLSMVMIFGGGNFLISAEGETSYLSQTPAPAAISEPLFRLSVSAPRTHLRVGETVQLTCVTFPVRTDFDWETLDSTIATVDSNGLVTALKPGLATIRAKKYDPTVDRTIVSGVSIYVHDSAGIEDNTNYYIMNYASGRLLSLEDSSDLPGTNVCTRPRSATTLSQWETSLLSDGRFKLRSVYSTLDQYLDVAGNEVDAFYDFGSECVKFNIDRVASGMYEGLYLIRYNDQYYVTQDENYNVCITSTPTDKSYWSFMKSNTVFASLYSLNDYGGDKNFNTSTENELFESTFLDAGYIAMARTNSEARVAYESLTEEEIFVFAGHGHPGVIIFKDKNETTTGRIIVDRNFNDGNSATRYISDIDDNGLATARVVIYMACYTGVTRNENSYSGNLVDETFDKGAHFVLGTQAAIDVDDMNEWLRNFYVYLSPEHSIEEAVEWATRELGTITVKLNPNSTVETEVEKIPLYQRGDSCQYISIG